jgi:hypothetical protein
MPRGAGACPEPRELKRHQLDLLAWIRHDLLDLRTIACMPRGRPKLLRLLNIGLLPCVSLMGKGPLIRPSTRMVKKLDRPKDHAASR